MENSVYQLKKQICEIGQRIWMRGYCAGNEGNHSVRVGPDRVLCTPTGISKGFMTPDQICLTDMNGKAVEPNARGFRPTSEIKVHLAIYRARADVKAVIHSHPPHATAFTIADIPVPEGIHPEAEVFLGKVRTAKYATPSKPDLAESVVALIDKETNTVLMGNHGSVSFSDSLIDAYYKLEILDSYCRLLLLTKQLGRINQLTHEQMTELLKVKQAFGLSDSRLTCAPQGCVGSENQPFFASFDVRPASAACHCDGGQVQAATQASGDRLPVDESQFEAMVQTITDQIMNATNRN